MLELYKQSVLSQFEAALWMLHDCIQKCPDGHWSGPTSIIGKFEYWYVAHHVLSWVDRYLSPNEETIVSRPEFELAGHGDELGEYSGQPLTRVDMTSYVMICLARLREVFAAETEESLRGESGFRWIETSRAELHLYSMRHVMHHTGQLSAFLRRLGVEGNDRPRWGVAGWIE